MPEVIDPNALKMGLSALQQVAPTPQQSSNPFQGTAKTTSNSQYLEGLTYDRNPEHIKAVNQGFWDSIGNAVGQTLGGIPLEIGEGIGYLGVGELIDKARGTEIEFGNSFSNKLREWNQQLKEQGLPVYTTPDDEGFQPHNYKWWAQNAPSIASAVSLLIPARGATWLAGKAGRAVGGLNLAKKLGIGTEALAVGDAVGMAAVSRHMEGMMEGVEVYETLKQQAEAAGKSADEAVRIASKGATETYTKNRLLLELLYQYLISLLNLILLLLYLLFLLTK
jgi:hypothetical protein